MLSFAPNVRRCRFPSTRSGDSSFEPLFLAVRSEFCFLSTKKNLGLKRKLYYTCLDLVSPDRMILIKRSEKLNAKYANSETDFIGSVSCLYNSRKNRFKKELFEQKVELDFAGHKLFAPGGYDEILTKLYGNYMIPPEIQETHHANEVYVIE